MSFSALRNLRSRAGRTILTVLGIAIGIFALVVVGSLAERLQTIVARSTALNARSVFALVPPRELFSPHAGARLKETMVRIRRFPGVTEVVPEMVLPYENGRERFGPPSFIFGFPYGARAYASSALSIDRGRDFGPLESRVALVGGDLARGEGLAAGDVLALYGNSYRIVGTLTKSFTIFDAGVMIPYEDALKLFAQTIPPTLDEVPDVPASALMVVAGAGADPSQIARRIDVETNLAARDPAQVAASARSTTQIFDGIIFGAALIALIVGAFSIVNTMTIAVTERTREIGIRKAIGAADGDILREFLLEASVIGMLGGVLGIAAAIAIVASFNARNAAIGNLELFAVTPRLALGAFSFSVLLSAIAGLLPAIRAARLDPTEALRRVA